MKELSNEIQNRAQELLDDHHRTVSLNSPLLCNIINTGDEKLVTSKEDSNSLTTLSLTTLPTVSTETTMPMVSTIAALPTLPTVSTVSTETTTMTMAAPIYSDKVDIHTNVEEGQEVKIVTQSKGNSLPEELTSILSLLSQSVSHLINPQEKKDPQEKKEEKDLQEKTKNKVLDPMTNELMDQLIGLYFFFFFWG